LEGVCPELGGARLKNNRASRQQQQKKLVESKIMKQVIDGKIYNTETALEIGNWSNGYYTNDFHHLDISLYRTKKGSYFLAGDGGAATEYGRAVGDCRTSGSKIVALSREDALAWAEKHLDADDVSEHFADILESA